MCGIFGIFSRYGDVQNDRFYKMSRLLQAGLKHRGPDGTNMVSLDNYAILGHTRLAINDVSGGSQPFKHKCLDGITSVVNGELYNYPLLRLRVSEKYGRLDTESDCEPIAFFLSGLLDEDRLSAEGMYAAACYNKHERKMILARDIFGEKPLYYYLSDEFFVFSSELKALAEAVLDSADLLEKSAVIQYMLYGYPIGLQTIYPGISQIEAGAVCSISTCQWTLTCNQRYWSKDKALKVVEDQSNMLELCRENLVQYVQQSTLSDVPICMGLSGGLDSALIAALNRDCIDRAFTVTYEAPGGSDEANDALKTARYLGIHHEVVRIDNSNVVRLFLEQVRRKDTPIVDIAGIGYAALYERMSQSGYKVALMGHGGDELFVGYPWLYQSLLHNLRRTPDQSLIYETLPDFRVYMRLLANILTPDLVSTLRWEAFRPSSSNVAGGYSSTFDLVRQYWLEPNSLKMGDAISMSFSIESRHPLLAPKVYSLLSMVDASAIFPEAKWPLRQILSTLLPGELIQREKRYFSPPYMAYYSMIHNSCMPTWKRNPVLRELGIFASGTLDRFYDEGFKGDWFDYYLFPRLSTLHAWIAR